VRGSLGFHTLEERGQEWVQRHMNPCGEMCTNIQNSKIPDGALPNSAAIGLREVLIVRAPGQSTTSIDLTSGAMWTLTIIHTPMFRTPLIMIASMSNAEMTDGDRAALTNAWNLEDTPPLYPIWENLVGDTYWSTTSFTALAGISEPGENGAGTVISQYRIAADGMTIYNNTPDLINQGMVIAGQFNTNQEMKVFQPDLAVTGVQVNLSVGFGAWNNTLNTIAITATVPGINNSNQVLTMVFNTATMSGSVTADAVTSWMFGTDGSDG